MPLLRLLRRTAVPVRVEWSQPQRPLALRAWTSLPSLPHDAAETSSSAWSRMAIYSTAAAAVLAGAVCPQEVNSEQAPTIHKVAQPRDPYRAGGGSFTNDFDISRPLGAGAFGTVWQCMHRASHASVAVKVVSESYEEAAREKAALTCVALAGGHANIVELQHHYTYGGFHYLAFELVSGMTLFDLVRRRHRVDEAMKQVARLVVAQVASAIAFLHSIGIVHCDLKPDNVMVTAANHVKLIDFGSASMPHPIDVTSMPAATEKAEEDMSRLASAPLSGTKSYWSPEMLQAKATLVTVVPIMDMWAIGCILYIMLCGQHPFDPRGTLTEAQVIDNILHRPVQFTQPVWATISPETRLIVSQLLEKDPARRMTAADLVRALGNEAS
ncbi:Aste57867_20553 [Aphanomyces stellatus]|uniref:Aste57867_20553 protein n=1 Tax=Aphanomyces stellatus TaxID=120398 RepID=A0A485LH92_9STRA|nr:hypothetical protein As57867_020486 [Aphanomyces stellatus]VFT97237.1 Aste57867_20553 [Aphanomyces stellatus]